MVASTLSPGDIAIIGYNSDDPDTFSFVALKPIGVGTVINFTDKGWLAAGGFSNFANDSTVTFTAAANIAAGTVIASSNPGFSGTLNLDPNGDQIIAYQGPAATPTLLYAIDFADGNTTFAADATNANTSALPTGLTLGTTAVAVAQDNAYFGGPATGIQATELPKISSSSEWIGSDTVRQTAESGPLLPPDIQIWTSNTGGAGGSLSRFDENLAVASNLATFFATNSFPHPTAHPNEIKFDTVHDKVFIVDSGGRSGFQILEGSISQILDNPGGTPTFTVLASGPDTNGNDIRDIQIDYTNHFVYFLQDTKFERVSYNPIGPSTPNQAPTVIATVPGNVGFEFDLDLASGKAYFVDSEFQTVVNPNPPLFFITEVTENAIYRVENLTGPNAPVTRLPFNPDDTTGNTPLEAFPTPNGTLSDVVVDNRGTATTSDDRLIFTTQSVSGGLAGVFAYNLVGNSAGDWTVLAAEGPLFARDNPITEITVDPINNQYFFTIENILNNGTAGVYRGSLNSAPTLLQAINGTFEGAAEATGITLDHQPTLALTQLGSTPTYTEQAGSPSAAGAPTGLIASALANDPDNPTASDQLRGATVAITSGFLSGASHQDLLEINGTTSGTLDGGKFGGKISYSYDQSTGVMTLSGVDSFARYQSALALVSFTDSGDNPTNFGNAANLTRTVSWTVSDGLISSDVQSSTINIVAINDAPVINGAGNTDSYTEQTAAIVLEPGITVSDVDSTNLVGATVTISGGFQAGDTLHFTNQNGISGSYDSTTHVLTLTGSASLANYTTALASVTFDNLTNDDPTNGGANTSRTITWLVDDGAGLNNLSNTPTTTINITAVNDAPDVTAPASYLGIPNVALTIDNVTFSDPDGNSGGELATFTVSTGTLTAVSGGGVSVNGSGTAALTLTGTIGNLDSFNCRRQSDLHGSGPHRHPARGH